MDKKYIVLTTASLSEGYTEDGYNIFDNSEIERIEPLSKDNLYSMQDIVLNCLSDFRKTNAEIAQMSKGQVDRFNRRLTLLNTSLKNRDEGTGYIILQPRIDGRIINVLHLYNPEEIKENKVDLKVKTEALIENFMTIVYDENSLSEDVAESFVDMIKQYLIVDK